MSISFQELCKALSLSPDYSDELSLNHLKTWCFEQVSRDRVYSGQLDEQYANYMKLAQHYLEIFLTSITEDLAKPLPALDNMNCVQYAAFAGYERFLSQLKTPYSDALDSPNAYDMTSLHFAALHGYVYTVEALLNIGALPNKANKSNQYPLFSTLVMPMYSEDEPTVIQNKIRCFKRLKALYPKALQVKDSGGETIAQNLTENGFESLLAELIIENKDMIFEANNHTHFPIHTALLNNRLKAVELLLAIPEVSLLKDAKGKVALHYAAEYSDVAVVEQCYAAMTNLAIRDKMNRTPLMLAAEAGNEEVLLFLLKKGADIDSKDYEGLTALDYAK
nr:ankyrin repeat domain-containing protein [Tatlockia sp.]